MVFVIAAYDIAFIAANAFSLYIIMRFFSVFLNTNFSKCITFSAYIAYFIFTTLSHFAVDIPIVNLAVTLVCMFIITLLYKASMWKRIVTIAFLYVLMFSAEILFAAVSGRFYIAPLEKGEYKDIISLFICKMVTFLIVLVIETGKYYRGNKMPPTPFLIATLSTPIISVVLSTMIAGISGVSQFTIILSIILLMIMNALTFSLYDTIAVYYERQLENAELKQKNTYYHDQYVIMQQSVESVKRFRHDYNNHLGTITRLLHMNRIEAAREYLSEIQQESKAVNDTYVETGNIVVDSILNYKLDSLSEKGIRPELDVLIPKDLYIETVHFVSILTNLLDNALEALEQCEDTAKKILRLRMVYAKGRLLICVQNSYTGNILYDNDVIISSKTNPEDHGMGLENVHKAVEHYNGLVNVEHSNSIFSVQVLLYID